MKPKAKAKTARNGANTRRRLLQAALALFARKGYAATTVREIVSEAGVTAPSLYYFFGNKEGLFLELMEIHCAMIDAALGTAADPSGDAGQRLKQLVDGIFRHVVGDRDFFRLMFSIYYGPPQGAPNCDFIVYHVKFHAAIKAITEEGIAAGVFRPGNPSHMTWLIRGVVQLAMEEQVKEDRDKITREGLQHMIDLIIERFRV